MSIFWRNVLADARWGLMMGVVLTVVNALPHKPRVEDAVLFCGVTVAVSVFGSPIARRIVRSAKGPDA